jgi:hypothetical protein
MLINKFQDLQHTCYRQSLETYKNNCCSHCSYNENSVSCGTWCAFSLWQTLHLLILHSVSIRAWADRDLLRNMTQAETRLACIQYESEPWLTMLTDVSWTSSVARGHMLGYHSRFGLQLFLCSYAHLNSLVTILKSPAATVWFIDCICKQIHIQWLLLEPSGEENYHCNRLWGPIGLWHVEAPTLCRQPTHRWQWACQPYAPVALYSWEDSWCSSLLEPESNLGPQHGWNYWIGNSDQKRWNYHHLEVYVKSNCLLPSEPATWCTCTECSVQQRPEGHRQCPH